MDDELIREMFSGLGPVAIRRMFGGKGIYHDGLIVGVVVGGELMLKGDERTAADVEQAGGCRWTYEGKAGRTVGMPYWTVPESAMDDPDEMAAWTRMAFEAARRASAAPAKPRSRVRASR